MRHPNQQSPFPGRKKPTASGEKVPEYQARAATQSSDIASLERVQAARPLKPPTRQRGA